MSTELRPELEQLPERMKDLPAHRGYPVPWFVDWIKDETGTLVPEFRAMDQRKWRDAVRLKLCWVCGKRLGAHLAFLIGPMCGITRTTSEPPCHLECAEWSARNCPFLSRPHAVRRELDHPDARPGAGIPIMRNPGASVVWTTRNYELFDDGTGQFLIRIGDPERLSFWAEGRTATRAEVETSIETGLPLLIAGSKATAPEELQFVEAATAVFKRFLPEA